MTRANLRPRLAVALSAMLITATAHAGPFTARDLAALARVGDPRISPDGRQVLYDVRTTDWASDRGVHAIWLIDLAGGAPRRLGAGSSARWGAGAAAGSVFFIAPAAGVDQVWRLDPAQTAAPPTQVTALATDVQAFRLSADGRTLVVAEAVVPGSEAPKPTPPGKATGVVFDKLFVRHWDTWADGTRNHLFALPLKADGTAGRTTPLTPGFDGDVPAKPFGGDDDFALSPDGLSVYFAARVAAKSEPWSTNFDIWRAPTDGSSAPVDLTRDNLAWDAGPVVSPDGLTLAWRAMKRPGFEADRFIVWLMDLTTGKRRELTAAWDRSPGAVIWTSDGRRLITTADDRGTSRLFSIEIATGRVAALTPADDHASSFDVGPDGTIVYSSESFSRPASLARIEHRELPTPVSIAGGNPNAAFLSETALSAAIPFSFAGWHGEPVQGWAFKPANYVASRKYPVAFLIHGGPQGSWANGWSYRWSPQVFTGAGYAVVMIDFHGSTGYGQAFTDSISGHWGDRPLEDLHKGWAAALAKNAFLDGNRACALGASYGGFMVNWIAGVWNTPWKCLVTHDGVFDDRSMGYSTEELWFSEWEHGHETPWADPAAYERFNPAAHVADWIKPQLIIHGGRDYRIPLEQGLGAFTALQRKGVESRFLYFPDENHWVLKPADALLWNATVLEWLDAHLKV